MKKCNHRRLKKNYPFGRKSSAVTWCKDCGEIVKPKELVEMREERKKRRRR